MSPLNGENSNPSEHTTNGLNSSSSRNGKSSQTNGNHNGLNNNHDEYNMDMKTNGNDKLAEDDPLTEPRKWDVMESTSETGQARFLQKFASTKFFMVIFLFAYVLQGRFVFSFHDFSSATYSNSRLLLHIFCERHHDDRKAFSHQVSIDRTSAELQ